jgi:uncharacterized protein
MDKETLKSLIRTFHSEELPKYLPRRLTIPLRSNKIISLIGPRRSGKTSELFNLMAAILEDGVPIRQLLYLNFEDERLDFEVRTLDSILQAYLELYPDLKFKECFFFFDEIQNIDGWERFVRRVHDSISKNIFITGSNAKLLSKEIATSLRGRALTYKVLPLSFLEYCQFKKIPLDLYARRSKAHLTNALKDYLQWGGFPEIIDYSDDLKTRTLQEYFNTMMYRDMIERYDLKHPALIKYFLKKLLSCVTKNISVNKLFNELKSAGFKISKQKLYDYLIMSENIFLGIVLKKYSTTTINQELTDKKIYIIDNGLLTATHFRFSNNVGKAMEQCVFLELFRNDQSVFYYKEKFECDFLIQEGLTIVSAIQVCYALDNAETRRRELQGLLAACNAFGLSKGSIITYEQEEEFLYEGIAVQVIPLIKWLLRPVSSHKPN